MLNLDFDENNLYSGSRSVGRQLKLLSMKLLRMSRKVRRIEQRCRGGSRSLLSSYVGGATNHRKNRTKSKKSKKIKKIKKIKNGNKK